MLMNPNHLKKMNYPPCVSVELCKEEINAVQDNNTAKALLEDFSAHQKAAVKFLE